MRSSPLLLPFLVLLVLLLSSLSSNHQVRALPAGFEDEGVVAMNAVVDIAFAGNMILAVTKRGLLYTYDLDDPNADKEEALDLSGRICDNGERGYVQSYYELTACEKEQRLDYTWARALAALFKNQQRSNVLTPLLSCFLLHSF